MRWEDERYVRLFTRDTTAWVAQRWEARAVWPLLMRKLDRVGSIDLGQDGLDGLAILIGLPVTIVRDGVTELVTRGTLVQNGTVLIAPNFMSAQEVPKTDAERAKTYRQRKRAELLGNPTNDVSPNSSQSSRGVTTVRDASQNVTPSCADPVLNQGERHVERDGQPVEAREPYLSRLRESYAELVRRETGHPFGFDRFQSQDFASLVASDHLPKDSIEAAITWLERRVRDFASATRSDPIARGSFKPRKFLEWLNDPKSVAKAPPEEPKRLAARQPFQGLK